MVNTVTVAELSKMTPADLLKEIRKQDDEVVRLRLGVKLGKEKDSAKYIREKKQLARMKTVYNQKNTTEQKEQEKNASATTETSVSSGSPKKTSSPKKK